MVDALSRPVLVLEPTHPSYPGRLRHLPDPPARVYVRGNVEVLGAPCVTIVGSRRSTPYGRKVAQALAWTAVRSGWTVVSGLALGIDGAAHRGAVEGGGATVAVLANGPERAQPRAHGPLLEALLPAGAAVSEHPPGTPALKHHFPRRNRLLAALAHRVVVVEAAERSGALITASLAAELGREVWAVPGSVYSPTTRGTHALLEDGATPVASLDAWARSLRGSGLSAATGEPTPGSVLPLTPGGPELHRRVWEALEGGPLPLEVLVRALAAPPASLLPALAALELEGWVTRRPGPVYLRRAA